MLAQRVEQRHARLEHQVVIMAVDVEPDGHWRPRVSSQRPRAASLRSAATGARLVASPVVKRARSVQEASARSAFSSQCFVVVVSSCISRRHSLIARSVPRSEFRCGSGALRVLPTAATRNCLFTTSGATFTRAVETRDLTSSSIAAIIVIPHVYTVVSMKPKIPVKRVSALKSAPLADPPQLTSRQRQILDWIRAYLETTGMPPTRAEIATGLGFSTPSSAEDHLQALARKGAIEMLPGASRGLRLKDIPGIPVQGTLPLVGRVAAGNPILAAENIEAHYRVDPNAVLAAGRLPASA